MNTPIILSRGDHARLKSLLKHECPRPWPDAAQSADLKAMLRAAAITDDQTELRGRAGLGAEISMVSTTDSLDEFTLRVVMPHEADVDADWIPITMPVSLAAIGRRCGDTVSWVTPFGSRAMRIIAVSGPSDAGLNPLECYHARTDPFGEGKVWLVGGAAGG